MVAQLIEGGVREISIDYSGEFVNKPLKPVTLSILKGFLDLIVGEGVNMVNAPFIAKERGIKITESTTTGSHDFASLLSVVVTTDKIKKRVDATVFGKSDSKIVRIDDYCIEASPTAFMLVFSNKDTPGVIGQLGTILGEGDVNIAGMQLGRNHPRGDAVSIMNLDSDIPEGTFKKITSHANIIYAKMIKL
jgi:D-3-phosphoglycerate dehydrogenase